jgi:8-oxo-dGTP pyrophosphatase MutT (NUDIX family)
LWEGNLPLSKIHWKSPILQEYTHSNRFRSEIEENWIHHKTFYPADYDGISLFLYDYTFSYSELYLYVGTIQFSTMIYLYKHHIPINKGLGVIGVQSLIFSPDKSHILIGKRALNQEYFPGSLTLPGGIMEIEDFMKPASESLMREIHEEVPLEFEPYGGLFSILAGWNPVSMTFLLYNTVKPSVDFDFRDIISGDEKEWEGNLRWMSMHELKKLSFDKVINGLYYYKWRIR